MLIYLCPISFWSLFLLMDSIPSTLLFALEKAMLPAIFSFSLSVSIPSWGIRTLPSNIDGGRRSKRSGTQSVSDPWSGLWGRTGGSFKVKQVGENHLVASPILEVSMRGWGRRDYQVYQVCLTFLMLLLRICAARFYAEGIAFMWILAQLRLEQGKNTDVQSKCLD